MCVCVRVRACVRACVCMGGGGGECVVGCGGGGGGGVHLDVRGKTRHLFSVSHVDAISRPAKMNACLSDSYI